MTMEEEVVTVSVRLWRADAIVCSTGWPIPI
jgi:hypothetical protein